MTVYHRPPRPTFTGDVLSRMRTSMPAIHEPITQAVGQAASSPAHPEEIRANVKLRLGKRSRLNAPLRNHRLTGQCAIFLPIDLMLGESGRVQMARPDKRRVRRLPCARIFWRRRLGAFSHGGDICDPGTGKLGSRHLFKNKIAGCRSTAWYRACVLRLRTPSRLRGGSVSTSARWRIAVVVGYAPARFRGDESGCGARRVDQRPDRD